jgi:hypothetical protein
MMTLTRQARALLAEYLAGSVEARQFDERFGALTFAARDADDSGARDLCRSIEWAFSDYERGLCSGAALRATLEALAAPQEDTLYASPIVLGGALYQPPRDSSASLTLLASVAVSVQPGWLQVSPEMVHA